MPTCWGFMSSWALKCAVSADAPYGRMDITQPELTDPHPEGLRAA